MLHQRHPQRHTKPPVHDTSNPQTICPVRSGPRLCPFCTRVLTQVSGPVLRWAVLQFTARPLQPEREGAGGWGGRGWTELGSEEGRWIRRQLHKQPSGYRNRTEQLSQAVDSAETHRRHLTTQHKALLAVNEDTNYCLTWNNLPVSDRKMDTFSSRCLQMKTSKGACSASSQLPVSFLGTFQFLEYALVYLLNRKTGD